jgi:glycosyltransferase involved in cell wall biosynthesis
LADRVFSGVRPKRILYLYTEVMGYTLATIRELVDGDRAEVHVVHWDQRKLTPFQAQPFDGLHLYARSSLAGQELSHLVRDLAPDLAVVSGWQDRGYLPVARLLRGQGVPVVVGFDDQWHGTLRQRAAAAGRVALQAFFSHAWVTGPQQYDYARRMGFAPPQIIQDLYSADVRIFQPPDASDRRAGNPQLVFVGRLERVKGIDVLLEAWEMLREELPDWDLLLIGNGTFEASAAKASHVRVRAFLSPEDVAQELRAADAFVLPSRHEPWGVALHEAVASGLPVLCSRAVGAAATFVISGFNGVVFEPDSAVDLARAIRVLVRLGKDGRKTMGERSVELSRRISPATSAANLLSLFETAV